MTSFVTTINKTIYFPTREDIDISGLSSLATLSHEYVHVKQANKYWFIFFSFLYLFPQIIAPLMLLFCFLNIWVGLGLFILFLAPLPAPFRTYFEFGGYSMSLFVSNELLKEKNFSIDERRVILMKSIERYNTNNFKGPAYYFMWIFGIENKFAEMVEKILAEKMEDEIYLEVSEALKLSKI
jgi:hypothetical protein